MSASVQGFRPRLTRPLGVAESRGWQLKWYAISVDPDPLDDDVVHVAREAVQATLPAAEAEPAVGFVIVHRGEEAVWRGSSPRCGGANASTSGRCTARSTSSTWGSHGPTACVWELVVHNHERDAFVSHILSGPRPARRRRGPGRRRARRCRGSILTVAPPVVARVRLPAPPRARGRTASAGGRVVAE
jgi:hypothetical protein